LISDTFSDNCHIQNVIPCTTTLRLTRPIRSCKQYSLARHKPADLNRNHIWRSVVFPCGVSLKTKLISRIRESIRTMKHNSFFDYIAMLLKYSRTASLQRYLWFKERNFKVYNVLTIKCLLCAETKGKAASNPASNRICWISRTNIAPIEKWQVTKNPHKINLQILLCKKAYVFCRLDKTFYCCLCVLYNKIFFTELGRCCRCFSRCADLCIILQWRASDLLAWNSVDTTCKTK
jgi:hypothetical protein